MFQMLKPGELGSHLLQTLDGFIFVLSRCSKITRVIINTRLSQNDGKVAKVPLFNQFDN